jgi:hypothetical protein
MSVPYHGVESGRVEAGVTGVMGNSEPREETPHQCAWGVQNHGASERKEKSRGVNSPSLSACSVPTYSGNNIGESRHLVAHSHRRTVQSETRSRAAEQSLICTALSARGSG